jgi:thiamine biosynthesis lipoprotein
VTGPDAVLAEEAELAVFAEVERLEPVFSVFDEDSALWELRRTGTTAVDELQTVLGLAQRWMELTAGAFCPTMAPLMELWGRAEERGLPPTTAELERAVTEARQGQPEHVDLNGIAKGWIADRAVAGVLPQTEAGTEASAASPGVWLSLGGDLVHRGGDSVVVGIEDPKRPYDNVAPLATVEVTNEAVATSGGGRRWWTILGERHSKVLDPRSGQPTDTISSATVVAESAATADVLATTALALGPTDAAALVTEQGGEYFFVLADGSIECSSGRFRRA